MPWDEPDPIDPNVLCGVALPGDETSVREMAYAFAEEYASLGFDEQRILRLFHDPHYAGPYQGLQRLGEMDVRRVVRECIDVYGRVRVVVTDAPEAPRDLVRLRLSRKGV